MQHIYEVYSFVVLDVADVSEEICSTMQKRACLSQFDSFMQFKNSSIFSIFV
jgi:hypothetical protein